MVQDTSSVSSAKFISEPKKIYPLEIEGLQDLVVYDPDEAAPEGLRSKVSQPRGSLFAKIRAATEGSKRWSSVQVSKSHHIELNSALVYMNHSCQPSMVIHTDTMEVRVSKHRDLQIGDELNFFYPSTEFRMDKPFQCCCDAGPDCLGLISGADNLNPTQLSRYEVNRHILELKKEQGR